MASQEQATPERFSPVPLAAAAEAAPTTFRPWHTLQFEAASYATGRCSPVGSSGLGLAGTAWRAAGHCFVRNAADGASG